MSSTNILTIAYAAGLFDGEGCISLSKSHGRNGLTPWYQLHVKVSMTDLSPLELLHDSFGGSVCTMNAPSRKLTAKGNLKRVIYQWQLKQYEAGAFLEAVLPWLLVKSRQAQLALEYLGSITPAKPHPGIPPEEISLREGFYQALRDAKQEVA